MGGIKLEGHYIRLSSSEMAVVWSSFVRDRAITIFLIDRIHIPS
ncbi:hypothetical protein [Metabacillus endolithicus]